MKPILLLLFSILIPDVFAQKSAFDISDLTFRNIGPASPGGRVVDIEAQADDFTKVYVASASGGVWKSANAGITWQPIFDRYETASIGDIALDPTNSNTIWVGTGEANNRNSVSWGHGIYKSVDGGKNFINLGLQSTHQISRVLVNPKNADDVCVCAIGHLWGYTGDRGLYRTKDGGKTWNKKSNGLPNDGKTGCIDLVRDSKNPNVLYAAFYERLRYPWHFHSGGDQGGVFKSIDGGESWKKLSTGLPSAPTGRIGLAISDKKPNIVMAIIEAKKSDTLAIPGSGVYRSENGGQSWNYVNIYNNRPFYYSQIRINPHDDKKVYILSTRFMISEDGGKTFKNGSEDQEVHGDFHALWLDPKNKDRYYLGADKGFSITHDHGAHFQLIDNLPITQYYFINYDMQLPYMIYGGLQDNGSFAIPSFTRDARGILNDQTWKMHWGDGQEAAVNPFDHTDAYTGMENGNYFKYNPMTRELNNISPNSTNVANFSEYIHADDSIKDVMRFNWSSPFVLSPHDPRVIYLGGNHIYKSNNKGKDWKIISPDLTTNDPIKRKAGVSGGITPDNTGAETHCTVSSFSVSSINEDIIWVGTDDGLVHCSLNGGKEWTDITLPESLVPSALWVSHILASHHHPGRGYVAFDGHRSDLLGAYIFTTDDYGKTWKKITDGFLPQEVIRVIIEDAKNPNLIFAGTETGVWMSINRGSTWNKMAGLPTVSVYDLKIHPRENDLIVATHGRGIWIMDNISSLQQLREGVMNKPIHLYNQNSIVLWQNTSRGGQRGHFLYAGENPKNIKNTSSKPRAEFTCLAPIDFYVGATDADSILLSITDVSNNLTFSKTLKAKVGINRYYWNREFDAKPYTEEELNYINSFFLKHQNNDAGGQLRTLYSRFQNAKSIDQKRKALTPLFNAYSNSLPRYLGMPEANAGLYQIKLKYKNSEEISSIELMEDLVGK